MTVMSWDEWARHDATAPAAEVRAGRVTPRELAEQAAEGVARLNPKVHAIIEVFADTLSDPDADRPNRDGALYGVPMFLKNLGSGLIGRTQDSGSGLTLLRIRCISSATSGSSRLISRGPRSMTVTRLPKRR
jgi:amidase